MNHEINEKKVSEVNNEIKSNTKNPIVVVLSTVVIIAICVAAAYFVLKLVKNTDKSEAVTTTTTTTSNIDRYKSLILDISKVRKFQNEKYILILSNSIEGVQHFILIEKGDKEILSESIGDYEIDGNDIILKLEEEARLFISEKNLKYGEELLQLNNSEMKNYITDNKTLILNAVDYYQFAFYVDNNTASAYKFEETKGKIVLDDNIVFIKKDNTLLNGDDVFTLN